MSGVKEVTTEEDREDRLFTYADARPKNGRTYADAPGGGGGIKLTEIVDSRGR
jgi:hypothetical protein